MILTAAQLRAARGLLDWTRSDLAKAANISPETVKNIEHGTFRPQEQTAEAIVKAFGAYDVQFTENEGVQIKRDYVVKYENAEGFKKFFDDVYDAARDGAAAVGGTKPICISNVVDDRVFAEQVADYFPFHVRRMNELKNMTVRILIQDKPHTRVAEESQGSYREYRRLSESGVSNVPFYVYGDKLAILIFDEKKNFHIVVISSAPVAKAYREQFEILWRSAKPLEKQKG
ncbi:MAG: helix-turn-helix transcriptional regulator [Pseudomonadota bacterium]|nr:helix-turn-helix transcriptional regulator [Pseudomonadota bacterium]